MYLVLKCTCLAHAISTQTACQKCRNTRVPGAVRLIVAWYSACTYQRGSSARLGGEIHLKKGNIALLIIAFNHVQNLIFFPLP